MSHYDVVIIGGGVVGCSAAYQAAKRGLRTLLVERSRIASGASGAAGGMLGAQSEPMAPPMFELARHSRALFPALAGELRERSGIDIGLVQEGLLKVAMAPDEAAQLQRSADAQRAIGERAEWLSVDEARALEPALARDVEGALWLPDDGQVAAPDLTAAFAGAAVSVGAEIRECTEVERLIVDRGRVIGVKLDTGTVACGSVVAAGGVACGTLLERSGIGGISIFPVKGECFFLRTAAPLIRRTIHTETCYIVPKSGSRLLVGATVLPGRYDRLVSAKGVLALLERAKRLLPDLLEADAEWERAWSGLRPGTATGLPYIGRHPRYEGLIVAAGHYRNGILLSPITGKIVADLLQGTQSPFDLSPFAVPDAEEIGEGARGGNEA